MPRDHEVPCLPVLHQGPGCRCVRGGRPLVTGEPVGRKRPGNRSFSTVELPGAVGGPVAWRRPARDPAPGLQACCGGALLCGTSSSVPGDMSGSRRQPPHLALPRGVGVRGVGVRSLLPDASPAPPTVPSVTVCSQTQQAWAAAGAFWGRAAGGMGPSSPELRAWPPLYIWPGRAPLSGMPGRATARQQG